MRWIRRRLLAICCELGESVCHGIIFAGDVPEADDDVFWLLELLDLFVDFEEDVEVTGRLARGVLEALDLDRANTVVSSLDKCASGAQIEACCTHLPFGKPFSHSQHNILTVRCYDLKPLFRG